jgi:hypothetical protein
MLKGMCESKEIAPLCSAVGPTLLYVLLHSCFCRKGLLGRPSRKLEYNVKVHLKEIGEGGRI